jgi:hypothetical protein
MARDSLLKRRATRGQTGYSIYDAERKAIARVTITIQGQRLE